MNRELMYKFTLLTGLTLVLLGILSLYSGEQSPATSDDDVGPIQPNAALRARATTDFERDPKGEKDGMEEVLPDPAVLARKIVSNAGTSQGNDGQLPGDFVAPEQIEIASYEAIIALEQHHGTIVDEVICEPGHCRITLITPSKRRMNTVASDLMIALNDALSKNPLTPNVAAGLVAVSSAENGTGRIEMVTMERKASND